jgi:hypothetical protein
LIDALLRPSWDEGRVRIYKTKPFARFARKAGIADPDLRNAIDNAGRGLVDADLGGGARPGGGKSGGFRTIIVFRAADRAVFVRGFAKNELDNILDDELGMLKRLAAELLAYDVETLAKAVAAGVLIEVPR